MANEDKYDYYRIKKEFAKALLDEYTSLREIMRDELNEVIKRLGATGVITNKSIFKTHISAFSFPKDCSFNFKFSTKEIGDELMIKPYKNSKEGKAFSEKMTNEIKALNDKYEGKITICDWLIKKFNCQRELFAGFNLLASWAGADSEKELILIKIPITEDIFNPPSEFEKITYGNFYDLANS